MTTTGYIYALKNRSFEDKIYKIGMTQKNPVDRAKELSIPTGVPTPFELVATIKVNDPVEAEKFIFKLLEDYKVQGKKEFFKLELSQLKIAMRHTAHDFKIPILAKLEAITQNADHYLDLFMIYYQQTKDLAHYDSAFEYQSDEFKQALEELRSHSISLPHWLVEKIRKYANKENKKFDDFIDTLLIEKYESQNNKKE